MQARGGHRSYKTTAPTVRLRTPSTDGGYFSSLAFCLVTQAGHTLSLSGCRKNTSYACNCVGLYGPKTAHVNHRCLETTSSSVGLMKYFQLSLLAFPLQSLCLAERYHHTLPEKGKVKVNVIHEGI